MILLIFFFVFSSEQCKIIYSNLINRKYFAIIELLLITRLIFQFIEVFICAYSSCRFRTLGSFLFSPAELRTVPLSGLLKFIRSTHRQQWNHTQSTCHASKVFVIYLQVQKSIKLTMCLTMCFEDKCGFKMVSEFKHIFVLYLNSSLLRLLLALS